MTETSSTTTLTTRHSGGVIAHALGSVADHMLEHRLPAPLSIDLPSSGARDFDGILISLSTHAADSWRRHLVVTRIDSARRISGTEYRLTKVDGRLPSSGVRVRLQYATRVEAATGVMAAVPA